MSGSFVVNPYRFGGSPPVGGGGLSASLLAKMVHAHEFTAGSMVDSVGALTLDDSSATVSVVTGPDGGDAIDFTGRIEYAPTHLLSGDFAWSLWVKTNVLERRSFWMVQGSDKRTYMEQNNGSMSCKLNNTSYTMPAAGGNPIDGWHLFCISKHGTNVEIWWDGSLEHDVVDEIDTSNTTCWIGRAINAYIGARIAQQYMYNDYLSSSDVAELWNGGAGGFI